MTSKRHSTTCAYLVYHTRPCNCHLATSGIAVTAKAIAQTGVGQAAAHTAKPWRHTIAAKRPSPSAWVPDPVTR